MEHETYKALIATKSKSDKNPVTIASQRWSNNFYNFLISFNGGSSSPESAYQQEMHLRQILNGVSFWKIENLVNETGIENLQKWFESYLQDHEASSVITMVSTVLKFFKYLLSLRLECFSHERSELLKDQLNRWKTGFRKKKQGNLKFTVPSITPEEINAVISSAPIARTKFLSKQLRDKHIKHVNQEDHTIFRNSLLLLSALRNGCRSCALYNMRTNEFEEAQKVLSDGAEFYVVKVRNHKTVAEHGPAEIVLDLDLKQLSDDYLKYIRKRILDNINETNDFFFITARGMKLSPGDVSHGMQFIIKTAGLQKIGTTILRKLITTEVHDHQRDLIPYVASHLHKA